MGDGRKPVGGGTDTPSQVAIVDSDHAIATLVLQALADRVREYSGEFLPKQTGRAQFRELAALVRAQATG